MIIKQWKGGLVRTRWFLILTCTKYQFTCRKLIIDQMHSHILLPQSFPIKKSLLKSVRSSRQRYQEFLKEKEVLLKQNTQCDHRQGNLGSEGLYY